MIDFKNENIPTDSIVWKDLIENFLVTGKIQLLADIDLKAPKSLPVGSYYYDEVNKKEYFLSTFYQ